MPKIRRLVLDVLKPRLPAVPDFAKAIAALGPDYRVQLDVKEIDDQTVTTVIVIEGGDLDMEKIEKVIREMGGALHSIDHVEVSGDADSQA